MAEANMRERPAQDGIPGSGLAGPFPVGEYALALRRRLREFSRVQLIGELVNLRTSRARVYFELRDANGAIACSAWRDEWERMFGRVPPGGAHPQGGAAGEHGREGSPEGMQVVVAGGRGHHPGSGPPPPRFLLSVSALRLGGGGGPAA